MESQENRARSEICVNWTPRKGRLGHNGIHRAPSSAIAWTKKEGIFKREHEGDVTAFMPLLETLIINVPLCSLWVSTLEQAGWPWEMYHGSRRAYDCPKGVPNTHNQSRIAISLVLNLTRRDSSKTQVKSRIQESIVSNGRRWALVETRVMACTYIPYISTQQKGLGVQLDLVEAE